MPRILTAVVISLMVFSLSPALGQDQPATDELQWTVEEYPSESVWERSYFLGNGCAVSISRDGTLALRGSSVVPLGRLWDERILHPGKRAERRTTLIMEDGWTIPDYPYKPDLIFRNCRDHFPALPADVQKLFRGFYGIPE